jgi:aspartyl-tRNA(Asn)/glutamyl-tRNA(Gln) amidotransferase subunit A
VTRLEEAGAVVIGRTGLHEFAFGFSSENPWWGPVRNPQDPDTSPGGSSGGSAAAVAAGVVPIALGTDTGGSVRVPAALCGVVGLKPTHGRIPLTGVFPLVASIDTVGPLARTVGDAALAWSVLSGDDPADPWSIPHPAGTPPEEADPAALRVGVPHPWVDRPLGDDVATAFRTALDRISDLGALVVDVAIPEVDPPGRLGDSIGPEVAAVHRAWLARHPDGYGRDVRVRLEQAAAVELDEFVAALAWRASLRNGMERALAGLDVLVTPTTAVSSKRIGVDDVETAAGSESHRRALSWFTAPVNHAGLPALAVPLDTGPGPPPSLQMIGPARAERRLLALGRALEAAGIVRSVPR